jgi:hypothetical protein
MNKRKTHKYGENLVGQMFGELEILEIIPLYRGKHRYYKSEVVCHRCKSNSTMTLDAVLNGKTGVCRSCACKLKPSGLSSKLVKDITGQRFGHLVALRVDETKRKGVHWIFKCDCGREKSILGKRIRDGSHVSCGCSEMRMGNLSKTWKGYGEIPGKYWYQMINGAKSRNLTFLLTIEKAWDIFLKQDKKCALTGTPIQLNHPKTASLDRIDSSKGYTEDNVQWVHLKVNVMKMDLSEKELYNWCEKIIAYKNEKTTQTIQ